MKHPFIKKFIIIYLSAVALVLAYFIVKSIFTQDKEIELKSFNTSTQEIEKEELVKENKEAKFLLLPKK
jgi:amino acid permease